MQLDGSDFSSLVEWVEEKIGRKAAWAFAFTIAVLGPVAVVAAGVWWYLR